jgi:hypothetical protein
VVIGWLTRVVVALAILGILGFDAIAVGVARFDADDDGTRAAQAAATSWKQGHDLTAATNAAEASLAGAETLVPNTLTITSDGIAHLKVQRKVTTIVFRYIPGMKKTSNMTVAVSSGPALL